MAEANGSGGMEMRSELVTGALKHVSNRYQLTHLAAKAIRMFHRPNTRIADTTNEVLHRFSLRDPLVRRSPSSSLRTVEFPAARNAELRRAG
jgi:hypothetical protein